MFAPRAVQQVQKPAVTPAARPPPPRSLGNQVNLQNLARNTPAIQRKLTIGEASDPLEHEADRAADQVMRMPGPALSLTPAPPQISPKRAGAADAGSAAPAAVHNVLSAPGQPLPPASRAFFEPRFGRDLSGVRIHTDAAAAASAGAINARAYTSGRNIAFAERQYQPQTLTGQRLMAHELAHVLQQSAAPAPTLQRDAAPPAPAPAKTELNWAPSINKLLNPDRHLMVTEAQRRGIQELDTIPPGVWSGLDWTKVSIGAAGRIMQPELINQTVLGLCGPAAAINAEALQDPVLYARLVVNVFSTGKVGTHAVNGKLRTGAPLAGMDQSDWMLMSALQDVNNTAYDYYGTGGPDEKDKRDAHTTAQVEADMKATGCVATNTHTCYVTGEISEATNASNLLAAHPADIQVVMFVSAGILQGTAGATSKPNHFIRLIAPITFTEASISFKAFTWGHNNDYSFAPDQFKHLVSAFVIGSRNKDISI